MKSAIAYIAAKFPLRSETFVYREVRALRARGWDVQTVSLNAPDERGLSEFDDLERDTTYVYGAGRTGTLRAAATELLCHPIRSALTLLTAVADTLNPGEPLSDVVRAKIGGQAIVALGVARRLRKLGVRHVHCHFAHAPTTVGMYTARQLGVPFSFTGHANDLFQRRAMLGRKLERAAFVACISEWHKALYREICPHRADRFPVIRCGVDLDAWAPKTGDTREPAPGTPLRVLTVCRLVEKKGVDTLIRALAEFGRPWKLTVAGDGPERSRLDALSEELGCSGSIEWLGAVRNDEVQRLLAETDVFALPCRQDRSGDRDGIPVVLIEAMACGVPVVAGDLPAIRELVLHNQTGLLIDGNQPQALSAELTRLTDQPNLRETLAKQARQHVELEFSEIANIARLTREFDRAAAGILQNQPTLPPVQRPIKTGVS